MKASFRPFLTALAACWCLAGFAEDQLGPAESPLLVRSFSWRKEPNLSVAKTVDTYRADTGLEQANMTAVLAAEGMDPAGRRQSRERRTPLQVSAAAQADPVSKVSEEERYRYAATLWNSGSVSIRSVVWDYVFREPGSGRVTARLRFRSEEAIKPGRKKLVEGFTRQPPGTVASVAALRHSCRECESVEVERIVFANSSVWQRR